MTLPNEAKSVESGQLSGDKTTCKKVLLSEHLFYYFEKL